jgi:hypothetical protein
MKTSNKLIIAFALAITLIPLLGMVYVAQVDYVDGEYKVDEVVKTEKFSAPTKNMTSIVITAPFESINIADAKGLSVNIRLVNDEKFGIKIPDIVKDLVSTSVDAKGQLQITVKDKPNHQDYITILIYAPSFKQLNLSQAGGLILMAKMDSLFLNVKQTGSILFDRGTHLDNLSLSTVDVATVNVDNDQIKSMDLNLKNTSFKSEDSSFDNLRITTSGKSEIRIIGDSEKADQYGIKNLVLNTLDQTFVKFEGINIINCSGSFSDQTKVQMPAVNLNQMYKK